VNGESLSNAPNSIKLSDVRRNTARSEHNLQRR